MSDVIPAVDAHYHIWTPETHQWLKDAAAAGPKPGKLNYGAVARPFFEDDHQSELQGSGIQAVKGVYVQANMHAKGGDPVDETAWVQRQADADQRGMPQAIISHVDLHQPDKAAQQLAGHASYPNFRGVRFMLDWHPTIEGIRQTTRPDWMQDEGFQQGVALLERQQGLVFDLQVCQVQLREAAEFFSRYPSLPVVLNHAGFPLGGGRDTGLLAEWREGMAALAARPNTYVKISALCNYDAPLGYGPWTPAGVATYTSGCLELFGPERCMWASNLPVDLLVGDVRERNRVFLAALAHLSDDERAMVLKGNAERVYRI